MGNRNPHRGRADRRTLPAGYWLAAHRARRDRQITAGALQFLYGLARLARRRGDGVSVTLGERVLARLLGEHRSTIQRHKTALQRAGLITRTRVWARLPDDPRRNQWFWEETITLTMTCVSDRGPKMSPRPADSKQVRARGLKMSPSLIGSNPGDCVSGKGDTAAASPLSGTPQAKSSASKVEHTPEPADQSPPPRPKDAKEAEVDRRYADFARRIRELSERLRRNEPHPHEPPS